MERTFQWTERDNKHSPTLKKKHKYVNNVISDNKHNEKNKIGTGSKATGYLCWREVVL